MRNYLLKAGFLAFFLVLVITGAFAQTVTLDNAIRGATEEVANNLRRGNRIAILSVRSNSYRMSNYLVEELTNTLVNQRLFTIVDRAQLELIQEEMQFQMSGDVSDASAQAIGKLLGAQAIITGTFDSIGDFYRFRVRVIEIETAAIKVTYSANVYGDAVVQSLMGVTSSAPAAAAAAPAPGNTVQSSIAHVDGMKPVKKTPARPGNFELKQGSRIRMPIDMKTFHTVAVASLESLKYPVDSEGNGFIMFTIKGNRWWLQMRLCYWHDEYWYEYIGSDGLEANPALNRIHKNYPSLIDRVDVTISKNYNKR